MFKPELLSPAGDFECLKAAIQNGANAVYLGANSFSARAQASNFNFEELKDAIDYAHLRNVKINLTLNTLIKNNEFEDAFNLAKKAYEFGVDAIIVQDIGLAKKLIESFPDLPIHASTQMTAHNLEQVKQLERLGFRRVVLARELSIEEIKNICENTSVEIEVFIHGALCISYSGECLFSSMIGGRSGNRGKCAQSCRLPYRLLENDIEIDKGYLLSPRDLCSLENLKELIDSGVTCFKIEGRMKKPEYVAIVTSIYRKYIDKITDGNESKIKLDNNDLKNLSQVFNRGGFSTGHQSTDPNLKLVFKDKPNNMGICIGKVFDYNENKGYIKLELEDLLEINDTVSINDYQYHVSELMIDGKNVKSAYVGDKVTIGRMKGDNIKKNAKIYKIESKSLSDTAIKSFTNVENIKTKLNAKIKIHKNEPIELYVETDTEDLSNLLSNVNTKIVYTEILLDRIVSQLSKTGNTEFEFKDIDVDLESDVFISSLSILNEIRRAAISDIEKKVLEKYYHTYNNSFEDYYYFNPRNYENKNYKNAKIRLLLNILDTDMDYSNIKNVDTIYLPLKYFMDKTGKYRPILNSICDNHEVFIYMPMVTKDYYLDLIRKNMSEILNFYDISGFVVSNIGQIDIVKDFNKPIIANYTLNTFNNYSENIYKDLGFDSFTLSPELDKDGLLSALSNNTISSELIIYGKIKVMSTNYCLLGKSNKCYSTCERKCYTNNKYYLKDRMGFKFEVIPDNIQTVTSIYNSKTLSLAPEDFHADSYRIDILHESISEINNIIDTVRSGKRLEGKDYTNGNLNRII